MKRNYKKPVSCGLEMREKETSAFPAAAGLALAGAATALATAAVQAASSKIISKNFVGKDFIRAADKVEIVYE